MEKECSCRSICGGSNVVPVSTYNDHKRLRDYDTEHPNWWVHGLEGPRRGRGRQRNRSTRVNAADNTQADEHQAETVR
jgi:hypothetical protein